MFKRLHRDSQLRLITALGLSTAMSIVCFGIYRLFDGKTVAAAIDFTTAASICAPVCYALATGRTERAGATLCVIDTLCCILSSWIIGPVVVYWHYLVLITNFFIAPPRLALGADLLLAAALLLILWPESPMVSTFSIAASGALVIAFTYFFATHINVDRDILEEIASLDVLTGLPNRRTMESVLAEAIERYRARKTSFGLIILDIDHFKQVNDSFGHPAGDAVLVEFAAILTRHMRRKDKAFRFGGEEFVALVEVDDAKALAIAAGRIRKGIRETLRDPDAGVITVSAGAAMYGDEDNWQEWFSQADAALYRAKSFGRDQIVMADAITGQAAV